MNVSSVILWVIPDSMSVSLFCHSLSYPWLFFYVRQNSDKSALVSGYAFYRLCPAQLGSELETSRLPFIWFWPLGIPWSISFIPQWGILSRGRYWGLGLLKCLIKGQIGWGEEEGRGEEGHEKGEGDRKHTILVDFVLSPLFREPSTYWRCHSYLGHVYLFSLSF